MDCCEALSKEFNYFNIKSLSKFINRVKSRGFFTTFY